MNKKIGVGKLIIIALMSAIILAPIITILFEYFRPSGGFLGPITANIYVSTLFGLIFSIPLSFSFWGIIYFLDYKKMLLFILIPILFINLLWSLGDMGDFIELLVFSIPTALIGILVGITLKLLQRK